MTTGGRGRTALHGLDEERDDDVVRARDAVHLEVLREVARAVDERLGELALVRVARAVRDEQRVLGELGAPRDDGCDEPALPWGHARQSASPSAVRLPFRDAGREGLGGRRALTRGAAASARRCLRARWAACAGSVSASLRRGRGRAGGACGTARG